MNHLVEYAGAGYLLSISLLTVDILVIEATMTTSFAEVVGCFFECAARLTLDIAGINCTVPHSVSKRSTM
jgi:hypothetical protein